MSEFGKRLCVTSSLLFLSACINYYYSPGVHPIAEGKIQSLTISKPVDLANAQPISDRKNVIARLGASKWMGDLQRVTQALIEQLGTEIAKQGGQLAAPSEKTMRLSVTDLSVYQGTWTLDISLIPELELPDRPRRTLVVKNRSPGNMWRAVNGCIAKTVIELLNDPEVRDFLAT